MIYSQYNYALLSERNRIDTQLTIHRIYRIIIFIFSMIEFTAIFSGKN